MLKTSGNLDISVTSMLAKIFSCFANFFSSSIYIFAISVLILISFPSVELFSKVIKTSILPLFTFEAISFFTSFSN